MSLPGDVMAWLQSVGMERYAAKFAEFGYDDLEVIAEMTGEDFDQLGVLPGHKKKFQIQIRKLQGGGGGAPHAAHSGVAVPGARGGQQPPAGWYDEPQAAGVSRTQQERHTQYLMTGVDPAGSASTAGNRSPQHAAAAAPRGAPGGARGSPAGGSAAAYGGGGGGGGGTGYVKYAAAPGTVDAKSNVASADNPLVPTHKVASPKVASPSARNAGGYESYSDHVAARDDVAYVKFAAAPGEVDAKSNIASADNPLVPVHKIHQDRTPRGQARPVNYVPKG